MTWKALLLILTLLAIQSSCRRYETSIKFSQLKENNGWFYLQKFRYAQGVARIDFEIYVRGKAKSKSHQLYIQGIPSDKWQEQQLKKCKSSVTMPLIIETLRMTGQKIINKFQFSVSHQDTYYFVIKDCMQMFRKDYDNQDLVLHIKFHAFSNDIDLTDTPEKINQTQEDVHIQQNASQQKEESSSEKVSQPESIQSNKQREKTAQL